jgi:hypothetical protein
MSHSDDILEMIFDRLEERAVTFSQVCDQKNKLQGELYACEEQVRKLTQELTSTAALQPELNTSPMHSLSICNLISAVSTNDQEQAAYLISKLCGLDLPRARILYEDNYAPCRV